MTKAASTSRETQLRTQLRTRYAIVVLTIFSLFLNLLILVSPIFSMQVFDRVLPSRSRETLVYLLMFSVVAIFVLALLDALRMQALNRIARWWDRSVRGPVLDASILVSLRSGNPVTHGLQDLQTIRQFLARSGPIPLFDAPWVPFFLILLAILNPLIGALALGAAALLLGLAILNEFVTKSALKGISEAQMRLISSAGMAIRHSDTIQAMGMQGALANRYLGENDRIQAAQIVAADRGAWIGAMSKFVRISVQVAVMALGAWLVLDNKLTSGGMIAASIVLGRALAPVEQAIGAWRSFIAARESYGRIKQLLAVVSAEEDAMRLSVPTGRLGVEQLTYAPPNSMKPIVKGMSLDLEPGSVLSVIGPSAAGKSTLCRLLVGSLKPSAGHVRLDGADLYRWDRSDIGRHVGYLPQSVELFAGTVKENIARLGDVDDAAVERAAKLAGCDQMILHLPQGYETNVGDAGVYLSGGQRQRIALARAMYKEPKLIVLDEPDSNLDDVGVDGLVRAVDTLRRAGSTIVLVTHRPPLMRTSTRTAVVANGKLEIFGPTADVLQELRRRQEDLQKARSAPPGQPTQPKTTGIGGLPR